MDNITHADLDALESALASAYAAPWTIGNAYQAVVAPDARNESDANADEETFGFYGGALVCESAWTSGAAIVALRNAAPALIAAARAHLGAR